MARCSGVSAWTAGFAACDASSADKNWCIRSSRSWTVVSSPGFSAEQSWHSFCCAVWAMLYTFSHNGRCLRVKSSFASV
jgi:hypothetical protein